MNSTFPPIGKWMLQANGQPANWKGYLLNGKQIQEPINAIFIDHTNTSEERAREDLINALSSAGYPVRTGHSSGYQGEITGKRFMQIPTQKEHAFSNRLFLFNNNHGRVFGHSFKAQSFISLALLATKS